ncbi:MAG: GIY-YIG nuclease family protein [Candidatus Omnitrophica bacterium]|nr:GIY-YIG nuclease family protein [Candidatus Omnitrophota bacterium]
MNVYILCSKSNNRFYVGLTEDVAVRLRQHNRGENRSTKAYRPWALVRVEEYPNKSLALKREKFLKTGIGRKVLRNLCSLSDEK